MGAHCPEGGDKVALANENWGGRGGGTVAASISVFSCLSKRSASACPPRPVSPLEAYEKRGFELLRNEGTNLSVTSCLLACLLCVLLMMLPSTAIPDVVKWS